MNAFRSKNIRILVATDVMSRGIDVKEINMVINFEVPHDAEDYVHRVGRTARVNTKGEAVTLVTKKDVYKLRKIEKLTESKIPEFKRDDNALIKEEKPDPEITVKKIALPKRLADQNKQNESELK